MFLVEYRNHPPSFSLFAIASQGAFSRGSCVAACFLTGCLNAVCIKNVRLEVGFAKFVSKITKMCTNKGKILSSLRKHHCTNNSGIHTRNARIYQTHMRAIESCFKKCRAGYAINISMYYFFKFYWCVLVKESFPNLRLIRKSTFMPETPEFKEKSDYF